MGTKLKLALGDRSRILSDVGRTRDCEAELLFYTIPMTKHEDLVKPQIFYLHQHSP